MLEEATSVLFCRAGVVGVREVCMCAMSTAEESFNTRTAVCLRKRRQTDFNG